MATFTWEYWGSTGPAWTSISTNKIIFSGSGGLDQPVTVAAFQDETHIGNGDPGTDQCGANHPNNVKWTATNSMSLNGGAAQALNDTNVTADECTIRIRFTHGSAVTLTNVRFYAYDGTTTTTPATGVDVAAWEQGESVTSWTVINDETVSGAFTNGSIGGDNTSERLDCADGASATDHTYYIAISASPESVGGKSDFDFGFALTYS